MGYSVSPNDWNSIVAGPLSNDSQKILAVETNLPIHRRDVLIIVHHLHNFRLICPTGQNCVISHL